MNKFLKKLGQQAVFTAFNIYKDKKIQEWRGTGADAFHSSMKKASLGVRFYLLGLFIAGGGAAGTVLLTSARISHYFATACMYDKPEINKAFNDATCLLTWVGAIAFLLPLSLFLILSSFTVWRKLFVDANEKEIRG